MDKEKLETLKQEVMQQFNELSKQKDDIINEMFSLRGEHRLLDKLIKEWGEEKSNATE